MSLVAAGSAPSSTGHRVPLTPAGRFLVELFGRFLVSGRVRFRIGAAEVAVGPEGGPDVALRVHDQRFFSRVVRYGNLGLGEAFMDGDFTVEEGELHEFLTACLRSRIDERLRHD